MKKITTIFILGLSMSCTHKVENIQTLKNISSLQIGDDNFIGITQDESSKFWISFKNESKFDDTFEMCKSLRLIRNNRKDQVGALPEINQFYKSQQNNLIEPNRSYNAINEDNIAWQKRIFVRGRDLSDPSSKVIKDWDLVNTGSTKYRNICIFSEDENSNTVRKINSNTIWIISKEFKNGRISKFDNKTFERAKESCENMLYYTNNTLKRGRLPTIEEYES